MAISHLSVDLIIYLTCVFGLCFAAYNAWWVSRIKLHSVKVTKKKGDIELNNQEKLLCEEEENEQEEEVEKESVDIIIEIGEHISSVN